MPHAFHRALGALVGLHVCAGLGAQTSQTNTLLIVADDVGVDSVAAYKEGSAPPPTPHIDALAGAGVLFRNAYANPICSPTRATLHTGRYSNRTGVGAVVSFGRGVPLSRDEYTLPEILAKNGFQTALIGKWHLGDRRNGGDKGPNEAGWSHFAGHMWNIRAPETYFSWRKVTNGTAASTTTYATTENVDDAIKWIGTQIQNKKPWFCCLAFNAAHGPFHVPPTKLHSYSITNQSKVPLLFKAMVQAMDTEVGRLIKGIGATEMTKTNVIFVGDNGTPASASEAPFTAAHAKSTLYEGGINVPLIISGPAVANPGREVKDLVQSVDVFSTALDLVNIDQRKAVPRSIPLDGRSLVPYLKNTTATPRKYVLAERFGSYATAALKDGVAIRDKDYKLIWLFSTQKQELYHLTSDPFEKVNLLKKPLSTAAKTAYDDLTLELRRLRADYFPYGKGCQGATTYLPHLELDQDKLPRMGGTFTTLVQGASSNVTSAMCWFGLRKASTDLTFFLMPGCTQLVTFDALLPVAMANGTGKISIPIPKQPSLVGVTVYQQVFVNEPRANAQWLTATHGARIIVGGL